MTLWMVILRARTQVLPSGKLSLVTLRHHSIAHLDKQHRR